MTTTTQVAAIQGTILDCNPRCWACSRILIDYVTRPWGGLICKRSRCKAINSSEQRRCPDCGHLLEDGLSCLRCPPTPPSEHIFDAMERQHGEHPVGEEVLGQLGVAILVWRLDVDRVQAIWRRWTNDPTEPEGTLHRCRRCYGRVTLPLECCPQGLHDIIQYFAGPCVSGDATDTQAHLISAQRQRELRQTTLS